jgi:large subunit ribosomal protein L21
MYAVVKTGGKQYRVAKDDKIVVDHIEAEAGDFVVLDQVLMLADGGKVTVGTPIVSGAAVGATVLRQTRGPKVMVFRRKRRKNFRRIRGHRQDLTLLQISDIAADGKVKAPAKQKTEAKPKTDAPKTETKAAPKKVAAKAGKEAKKAAPEAAAKAAPKKTAKKASAKKPGAKKAAAKKK